MSKDGIELITVYRGRDSATYLASEFEKLGDDAEPLWVRQWPGENAPFKKMELIRQDQVNDLAKWDVKALKRLLKSAQIKPSDPKRKANT